MTALCVSLPPDQLSLAAHREYGIELKFDWEHHDLLAGETNLGEVIADAGIDPDRIQSIHLPPGLERRGDRIGMAVTRSNRAAIVEFVHEQLGVVPDAVLVAHTPKRFEYADLLDVIEGILAATDRRLTIENAAVESRWYRPEEIAFFAIAAESNPALDNLGLTVDSAHLPSPSVDASPFELDEEALETLENRLRDEGYALPEAYVEQVVNRSPPDSDHWLVETNELRSEDPYAPLLKTLWLCNDRVWNVHLNDPQTDDVPRPDSRGVRTGTGSQVGLHTTLDQLRCHEATVVLEPGPLLGSPTDLHERVDLLADAIRE